MAFIWKDKKSGSWYLDYTPPGGKARFSTNISARDEKIILRKARNSLRLNIDGLPRWYRWKDHSFGEASADDKDDLTE